MQTADRLRPVRSTTSGSSVVGSRRPTVADLWSYPTSWSTPSPRWRPAHHDSAPPIRDQDDAETGSTRAVDLRRSDSSSVLWTGLARGGGGWPRGMRRTADEKSDPPVVGRWIGLLRVDKDPSSSVPCRRSAPANAYRKSISAPPCWFFCTTSPLCVNPEVDAA